LGGGGGGGARDDAGGTNAGGAGGKGIVIIRTLDSKLPAIAIGASTTQSGGYYIYTFNDSGTIKWGN
jgi:hypothetical protein